jgi:hypothetical protein
MRCGTMRISWPAAAFAVLSASLHATSRADDPEPLWLKFDRPMSLLTASLPPSAEFWKYYITAPGDDRGVVREPKEVARYVVPRVNNDASACRLLSRNNYVGICRLVPPGYERARRLSWKWSVSKHPHGGRIGGSPNDQSMQVYVVFREVRPSGEERYTAVSFVWTDKTTDLRQTIRGRMPWSGSPRAEIVYNAIRNGAIPGELSEEVDLPAEYQKAFGKQAPPAWCIFLLADSNEVEPDVGRMTTDAVIRDLRLTK